LCIDTAWGAVEVWALGEDRFAIRAPGHEQIVTGFDEAQQVADVLSGQLGRGPIAWVVSSPIHRAVGPLARATTASTFTTTMDTIM
jgi:hypothetical protein